MTHGRHLQPVIISRPDLQSRRQRALFSAITAVAWALWGYLFLPVLSAIAWWFGLDLFTQYMLLAEDRAYLHTLAAYAGVVGLSAAIIVAWSLYNDWRFGGADHRKPPSAVTDEMLQERFDLKPYTLHLLRRAKVMILTLDKEGAVAGVSVASEQPDPTQRLRAVR